MSRRSDGSAEEEDRGTRESSGEGTKHKSDPILTFWIWGNFLIFFEGRSVLRSNIIGEHGIKACISYLTAGFVQRKYFIPYCDSTKFPRLDGLRGIITIE